MRFRDFAIHLRGMKHYVIAAFGTLLIGIYFGYTQPEHFSFFLQMQHTRLGSLVESMNGQTWLILMFIFLNNTILSILMVYAGGLFAIAPMYFLLWNGIFIGYVVLHASEEKGWFFVAKALIPHGIIEIPAIILACAYGIRFGFIMIESLLTLPSSTRRAINGPRIVRFLKLTFPLMTVLSVLMLLAAIIESTVTSAIVK